MTIFSWTIRAQDDLAAPRRRLMTQIPRTSAFNQVADLSIFPIARDDAIVVVEKSE